VVGTSAYGGIQALLGNGDGTFQPPVLYAIPDYTYSVAIADFNHDGKPDLAVAAWAGEGEIAILLGKGDGTFQPYQSYPAGQYPGQIAVADFNGDGNLDVATVRPDGPGLSVLLGNGDGTFQPYVAYALPVAPSALVTGDFNRDGHLDLAASGFGGISILLGNGDGTFQNPVVMAGSYSGLAAALATADFNGDGILDLAVAGTDGISVFLGKGDGAFKAPAVYPGGQNPLVIGDFNGDGKLDIAQLFSPSDYDGFTTISILRGNGDGTFQPPVVSAPQIALQALALGDFYGVGRLNLVSSSYTLSPVSSSMVINSQTTALVSPGVLTYAPTLAGKIRGPETVTVTNSGTAPLNITEVSISGPNAAAFALTTDVCKGITLPASEACTIGVSFSPSAAGPQTAFLNIADDAIGSPQRAGLAGNGTVLCADPGQVLCGDTPVGTTGADHVVKITNISASKVAITSIGIMGADKGDFYQYNTCGKSLNPKASCSVVVQFIPTKMGVRTADLVIKQGSVDGANPPAVPLSGTGT
jgi:VCBS repeat protein/centrosomal CEP192-like protein